MKTILKLKMQFAFAFLLHLTSVAQNVFPQSGNVGVGTASPSFPLHVVVSNPSTTGAALQIDGSYDGNVGITVKTTADEGTPTFTYINKNHYAYSQLDPDGVYSVVAGGNGVLTLSPNGNLGIGTFSTPMAKLDINSPINNQKLGAVLGRLQEGNTTGEGTFLGVRGYGTQVTDFSGKSFALEHSFYGVINSSISFYRGWDTKGGFMTFSTNTNQEQMRITKDGGVGIGTTDPGSFKLAVEGKIGAREVNVLAGPGWPDYVFENNYNLQSLEELSAYIKVNKHLPEVPSACVMEEKGVNLGEMNMLLLKKVEELTLYIIETNLKMEALSQSNEQLVKEIENIKCK